MFSKILNYSHKNFEIYTNYENLKRVRSWQRITGFKPMTKKSHKTPHEAPLPLEASFKQKVVRSELYCWEFFFHFKDHSCRWLFSDVIDYSPCLSKTFLLQAMHYVWETQILYVGLQGEGGRNTFGCWEHWLLGGKNCGPVTAEISRIELPALAHIPQNYDSTVAIMFKCPSRLLPGEPVHKTPITVFTVLVASFIILNSFQSTSHSLFLYK